MRALKASCSVLVPFSLSAPMTPEAWRRSMLARVLIRRSEGSGPLPVNGHNAPLWERVPDSGRHIRFFELSGTLRAALFEATEGLSGGTLLRMTNDSLQMFSDVTINYGHRSLPAHLESVDAHLLSSVEGVLTLHFDLVDRRDSVRSKTPGVALSDVFFKVFTLRHYRASTGKQALVVGLIFGRPTPSHILPGTIQPPQQAFIDFLGPFLSRAMWRASDNAVQTPQAVEIGTFANWLLLNPDENESPSRTGIHGHLGMVRCTVESPKTHEAAVLPPECKVGLGMYGLTHTHVYLDQRPDDPADARAILWRLRRAYREDYVAPPFDSDADVVVQPRGNRLVGVSREGSAALAWPEPSNGVGLEVSPYPSPQDPAEVLKRDHEFTTWPEIWNGLYRALLVHSVAATRMLDRRQSELARAAADSRLGNSAGDIARHRATITGLITAHATEALTFPEERAGGTTEYDEFYMAVRRVQGTTEAWERLRSAIADIARVEQALHDDQQSKAEEQRRSAEAAAARSADTLTSIASWLAIALVPAGIVQGAASLFPEIVNIAMCHRVIAVTVLVGATTACVWLWFRWRAKAR